MNSLEDEAGNGNKKEISDKTRKGRRLATVRYFLRTMNTNRCYVAMYVFCEILNLANVILQMFFMNYFLGGEFFDYGLDVLRVTELPMEERIDPLSKVFPKVPFIYYVSTSRAQGGAMCVQMDFTRTFQTKTKCNTIYHV